MNNEIKKRKANGVCSYKLIDNNGNLIFDNLYMHLFEINVKGREPRFLYWL